MVSKLLLLAAFIMCAGDGYASKFTTKYAVQLQDQVIRQAMYMEQHGYDANVAKSFIATCEHLKRYYCVNGVDWCMTSSLERRWIGKINKGSTKRGVKTYSDALCAYK